MSNLRPLLQTFGVAALVGTAFVAATEILGSGTIHAAVEKRLEQRRVAQHWSEAAGPGSSILFPGKNGGPVLLEFGDYLCEGCKAAHERMLEIISAAAPVKIVYRHTPNPSKPLATQAALTAICADEQNAFRSMHDQLMALDYQEEPDWLHLARQAGVADLAEFQACYGGPAARERLARDQAIARKLGVRGTPTFVTAKFVQTGIPPKAFLDSLMEAQVPR